MLRLWGGRRSVRRSVRGGRGRGSGRPGRTRPRGEVTTNPPDKLTKHLLPCHVRLLDGTDLYIQLPVSKKRVQIEKMPKSTKMFPVYFVAKKI